MPIHTTEKITSAQTASALDFLVHSAEANPFQFAWWQEPANLSTGVAPAGCVVISVFEWSAFRISGTNRCGVT